MNPTASYTLTRESVVDDSDDEMLTAPPAPKRPPPTSDDGDDVDGDAPMKPPAKKPRRKALKNRAPSSSPESSPAPPKDKTTRVTKKKVLASPQSTKSKKTRQISKQAATAVVSDLALLVTQIQRSRMTIARLDKETATINAASVTAELELEAMRTANAQSRRDADTARQEGALKLQEAQATRLVLELRLEDAKAKAIQSKSLHYCTRLLNQPPETEAAPPPPSTFGFTQFSNTPTRGIFTTTTNISETTFRPALPSSQFGLPSSRTLFPTMVNDDNPNEPEDSTSEPQYRMIGKPAATISMSRAALLVHQLESNKLTKAKNELEVAKRRAASTAPQLAKERVRAEEIEAEAALSANKMSSSLVVLILGLISTPAVEDSLSEEHEAIRKIEFEIELAGQAKENLEQRDPRVSRIAQMAANPPLPRDDYISVTGHHIAPTVPDEVEPKAKKRAVKFLTTLKSTIEDPGANPMAKAIALAEEWAATVGDRENPLTQLHRVKMLSDWEAMLSLDDPSLPRTQHWDRDVVMRYWNTYLHVTATNPKSKDPSRRLKARTVSAWCGLFLHSIVAYTRDPAKAGAKCGLTLLIKEGLYQKLKNQVLKLIEDFKLERHHNKKVYFGRPELELIIDHVLNESRTNGRQVAIQHILRWLLTFFFTARGSTLGAAHKIYRDLNYVSFTFSIFLLQHKKHIWTVDGSEQHFVADGVKKPHNMLFDVPTYTLIHLYLRGAFKGRYDSVEALCAARGELVINAEFADVPFFLEATPAGREFREPHVAAMARAGSDALRHYATAVGLPAAGTGALRREGGNMYALQLGTRFAKDVMNHASDEGPHRDSYSRNMENFRLVGVRLGETAGEAESAPGVKLRAYAFASWAVECLTRRSLAEEVNPEEQKREKNEAKLTRQKTNPELADLLKKRDDAHEKYLKCFNAMARGYKLSSHQQIWNVATGTVEVDGKQVEFAQGFNQKTALPIYDAFKAAHKTFLARQTAISRKIKRQSGIEANNDLITGPLTGSAEDRQEIIRMLNQENPSVHIRNAVNDAMAASIAPAEMTDVNQIEIWASNLAAARTRVGLVEATYDDDDDEVGAQDRVFAFFDRLTISPPATEFAPYSADKGKGKDTATDTATDGDDYDDASFERPQIEEDKETDVLNLPIADVRRAMFDYLIEPVLTARMCAKHKTTAEDIAEGLADGFKCPLCAKYTHRHPIPANISASMWKFQRHILRAHSPWKDLELQMIQPNGKYRCPAGDFDDALSVAAVRKHALSSFCANSAEYRALSDAHDQQEPAREAQPLHARAFRSHKAEAAANDSEEEDEPEVDAEEQGGEVDTKKQGEEVELKETMDDPMKELRRVVEAAAKDKDDEEVNELKEVLFGYLDEVSVPLPSMGKGRASKRIKPEDWDSLNLDTL
ncbi:hypothetical protein C8R43DRAFT_1106394 [Mycena crocata]|nr:hypothetical protein C8R43DRAFT_1106394 [Mycena crocata]